MFSINSAHNFFVNYDFFIFFKVTTEYQMTSLPISKLTDILCLQIKNHYFSVGVNIFIATQIEVFFLYFSHKPNIQRLFIWHFLISLRRNLLNTIIIHLLEMQTKLHQFHSSGVIIVFCCRWWQITSQYRDIKKIKDPEFIFAFQRTMIM